MYYAETHLNWHAVYTVRNSTMEIFGINNSLSINLIDPSIAQCRDGHCKQLRCDADKYSILELECADLCKLIKDIESKVESLDKVYDRLRVLVKMILVISLIWMAGCRLMNQNLILTKFIFVNLPCLLHHQQYNIKYVC